MTKALLAEETATTATGPVPGTRSWATSRNGRRALAFPEAGAGPRRGAGDQLDVDAVMERVRSSPCFARGRDHRPIRGAEVILQWLLAFPGDGWQQRWEASGADDGTTWIDALVEQGAPRTSVTGGVYLLILERVILPSYEFLAAYNGHKLFASARTVMSPEAFAKAEQAALEIGMHSGQSANGLLTLTKLVIHTGKRLDEIDADDVFEYREWRHAKVGKPSDAGTVAAWDILRKLGRVEDVALWQRLRRGQKTAEELVDFYEIKNLEVRDVLVRYLNERRPALDYSTWRTMAYQLAGAFWADVEHHHPEQDSLRLSEEVAAAWKQRLFEGRGRAKNNKLKAVTDILTRVRAFYLDIQEWALEDPSWVRWAAPSPVRRGDTAGGTKEKRKTTAAMHQRVRDRLPQLPALVAAAERHLATCTELLTVAEATAIGQTFVHSDTTYQRVVRKSSQVDTERHPVHRALLEVVATGERVDAAWCEDDAFWSWAVIETLRHTGARIEEVMELTHLALISYRVPKTGEIVPMLQIVPSKANEERLLVVSPELASVLATVITRLRRHGGNSIPLVTRYDGHERVTGPPLPHLFQRPIGWRNETISYAVIKRMLTDTIVRAGITDAAGQPMRYTPHDFRRIFSTEAVSNGLPIHIAAKILGHKNLNTTEAYTAVFQDDLVSAYRVFLDKRRAMRPEAEYREPTDAEWTEFQQHFELRKVELGSCARPYGSPCRHEHACVRCPMLRVDPAQHRRLEEIIANLNDRIAEAQANGWLGEVEGLRVSRDAAATKLVASRRAQERNRHAPGTTMLGIPTVRSPRDT